MRWKWASLSTYELQSSLIITPFRIEGSGCEPVILRSSFTSFNLCRALIILVDDKGNYLEKSWQSSFEELSASDFLYWGFPWLKHRLAALAEWSSIRSHRQKFLGTRASFLVEVFVSFDEFRENREKIGTLKIMPRRDNQEVFRFFTFSGKKIPFVVVDVVVVDRISWGFGNSRQQQEQRLVAPLGGFSQKIRLTARNIFFEGWGDLDSPSPGKDLILSRADISRRL